MSTSSLSDLLASQLPAGLAQRARALMNTQAAIERALPAAASGHVRVMQLENGVLSLACDSGAVASRLRHEGDAMLARLAQHGVAATRLQVSVNPALLPRYVHPVEKNGLPDSALQGLSDLNAGMEAGPLKDALNRLLEHHAKR